MTWTFTIPGQPPSVNNLYDVVTKYRRNKAGMNVGYASLSKSAKATIYQTGAVLIIRSARPSRWAPPGQVRVSIRLFLGHDVDADNIQKTLMDAIQDATGINDRMYLPCVESKVRVPRKEARVEVIITEIP